MGYTTYFKGGLTPNKPLDDDLKNYINHFCNIRHMKRDVDLIKKLDPEWEKHCYNGSLGSEGQYYLPLDKYIENDVKKSVFDEVDKEGYIKNFMGQVHDLSVVGYNIPADGVPGLWCSWTINEYNEIVWNGAEKFYSYIEWLKYLFEHFLTPNGILYSGNIKWIGESSDDEGTIIVKDNEITIK